MARIVADRGVQFYQNPNGGPGVRYREFDLDCSCTLRVDERYFLNTSGSTDMMSRLTQVADAHICEIEVFMVHTQAAQLARTRAAQARRSRSQEVAEPALRYMGMDVAREPDSSAMWLLAVNPPRPRRGDPGRAPQQDIEAEVTRAAAQVRGVGPNQVVVDEVGAIPRVAPGAVAVELARRSQAKKEDPPSRPDRFDLIEID